MCSVNDQLFLQRPIDWEWGPIFVAVFLFLAFAESYKAVKRRYFPHKSVKSDDVELSPMGHQ